MTSKTDPTRESQPLEYAALEKPIGVGRVFTLTEAVLMLIVGGLIFLGGAVALIYLIRFGLLGPGQAIAYSIGVLVAGLIFCAVAMKMKDSH